MNHGTLGCYVNHRCRCASCRRARRDYDAGKRRSNVVRFDLLRVTCWCEATFVGVPPEEVRALRTRSCGAARCVGPDDSDEGMTG